MPKLNVYALERPARPVTTETFTENGQTLTIAFRRPDAADLALAAERAQKLTEDWITGSEIRGPAPFPYEDVKPSRVLFDNICVAVESQVVEEPGDAYTEIEFLLLAARLPNTWLKIQRLLRELSAVEAADPKESPPAAPTA